MPTVANVVPVIDTSYSMTANGYVDITKRDGSAFVSYARPGDGLGVVNYDTNGNTTQAFAVVDQNLTQAIAAAAAIQGLPFNGSSTAIGLGLQTAEGMLNSQANPRGIVLLSDGFQNAGPAPLSVLPSGYPVYACAMGQHADTQLMQQIAQRTGGQYYNAPFPSTMMFIFNQIRGLPSFVRTIANLQNQIQVQGYTLVPAPISGANSQVQFGVVWDDNALSYTSSANPSTSQISITLVAPNAPISSITPVIIGVGYVVFDVPLPQSGQWYIQVISGSNSTAIQVTSGAFEFPTNSEGAADLVVIAPDSLAAGQPLSVEAQVIENGKPIDGLNVRVEVMHPTVGVANALATHRDALKGINLTEQDRAAGVPEEHLRLAKLRLQLLPSQDIFRHRTFNLMMAQTKLGKHTTTVRDTNSVGSYNIHVIATGRSPETNTMFQRSHLVTVLVNDRAEESRCFN